MIANQLACAAEAPSWSTRDSATALEIALRAQYPTVVRWQLSRVSIVQHKRRPKLFAAVDGHTEIRRDGALFFVQLSPSAQRIGYRVAGYQPVNVAAEHLSAGETLRGRSMASVERDLLSLGCTPLSSDLEGSVWRVRRLIKPDEVLCLQDVELRPMIVRNAAITIRCDRGAVAVATSGVALSDGERGQTIQVRRQGRYSAMRAIVVEEGEVNACI